MAKRKVASQPGIEYRKIIWCPSSNFAQILSGEVCFLGDILICANQNL